MGISKILLVEDNFITNHAICEFLRDLGHIVKPVYCGKSAFEAIDRREYLAALVTDIDLGPGPDGLDVARYARAFTPDLPVVFMSGTRDPRLEFHGIGGSEFVAKPFHPRQIAAALDQATRLEAA